MVGRLKNADQTRETHIRFRNIDDFESYLNAFDQTMNLKTLFSTVIFIKSIPLNLMLLIEANMELVVILNLNLLNIDVIFVLHQQKDIVLLNELIS